MRPDLLAGRPLAPGHARQLAGNREHRARHARSRPKSVDSRATTRIRLRFHAAPEQRGPDSRHAAPPSVAHAVRRWRQHRDNRQLERLVGDDRALIDHGTQATVVPQHSRDPSKKSAPQGKAHLARSSGPYAVVKQWRHVNAPGCCLNRIGQATYPAWQKCRSQ
jgi:hypothetical protein